MALMLALAAFLLLLAVMQYRWLGQLSSAEQRLQQCAQAREGASLNTLLWRQLQTHLKAGETKLHHCRRTGACSDWPHHGGGRGRQL